MADGPLYVVYGVVDGVLYPVIRKHDNVIRLMGRQTTDVYTYNPSSREFDVVVPDDLATMINDLKTIIGTDLPIIHANRSVMAEQDIVGKVRFA